MDEGSNQRKPPAMKLYGIKVMLIWIARLAGERIPLALYKRRKFFIYKEKLIRVNFVSSELYLSQPKCLQTSLHMEESRKEFLSRTECLLIHYLSLILYPPRFTIRHDKKEKTRECPLSSNKKTKIDRHTLMSQYNYMDQD
ncbi:hypothetical protein M9H77_35890 [Catharanthus roseus]|uniref:Uncharacterized protein n=1 Tax=Catharanthus roseus TaxID=4058 RepID=A0ACB9ZTZ0_CATRO|nr:hypothetical protein M9H77_35890 [Catharanthus roseus]